MKKARSRGSALKFVVAGALALAGRAWAIPEMRTELVIAAASDLRHALDEAVRLFSREHPGTHIRVTYGSSGNFTAQIRQDAPFDLFFSADRLYSHALVEDGRVADDREFLYAAGRLVLWIPRGSKLPIEVSGLKALLDPSIRKIAIANPAHAPYGRAAIAALKEAGVYEVVKEKLVLGESVTQAAQFVQSGGAEIGLIALGLALGPEMVLSGRHWVLPLASHPPLQQSGVVLKQSRNLPGALAFRAFITGPSGQGILRKFGFSTSAAGAMDAAGAAAPRAPQAPRAK